MALLSFGSLGERVKDFRRDRRFAAARKRLMKQYGFTILPARDEPPEFRESNAEIGRMHTEGRFEDFAALYDAAETADVMLCNGLKLHIFQWNTLTDGFDDEDGPTCDRLCATLEQWWLNARTPMAAAAYASALHEAAFAYRGGGFADTVSEEQWAQFNARLDKGRAVLAETAKHGATSLPWCWTHYDYGLHDAQSFEEFHGRFQTVWSLDTSNWRLCLSHGFRLLPRWWGEDARDLEGFARHAASVTQDRFGAGIYALIYGQGYHIGSHEIGDTVCDVDLLKRGYEDMAERYPSQSLFNRWAAGLYFAEQYRSCERVFKTQIKAIVPELWSGDDREEQIKDALDTFYVVET